jgi:broad specificity phosphatase PhoE
VGVLLLVRHGQASFGADDYDVLSPRGAEQARALAARLAPVQDGVRRVVSGGLQRQRSTATELLGAWGRDPAQLEVDARWDEYDAVDVLTGVPVPPERPTDGRAFQQLLDEGLARWTSGAHDTDYRETWPAFSGRVRAALQDACAGAGTTVVVASAGSVAAACAALLDAPPPVWAALARTAVNAAVTKVVTGRSCTSLVSVNDHAHLEARPDLVTYR